MAEKDNKKKETEQEVQGQFNEVQEMPAPLPQDMMAMPPMPPEFMQKPKKKNGKKFIIAGVVLLVVGAMLFGTIKNMLTGPPPIYIETQAAEMGTVQQTINTSGTLTTGEKVTIYSPATAPITEVNAEVGTYVAAGTQMITFDTVALDRNFRQAAAGQGLSGLQAQAALDASKDSQKVVNDTQASIDNMRDQKNKAAAIINELNAKIHTAQGKAADLTLQLQNPDLTEEEKLKLQSEMAQLEAEIKSLSEQIAVQQGDMASAQAIISQMDAANAAADKGVLNDNGKQQLRNQAVPSQVAYEAARDSLAAAQAGVQAPINGVITALSADTGMAATQYTPLCVIESLDKVDVVVGLSRFDLELVKEGQKALVTTLGKEYEATVTKINAMATPSVSSTGSTALVMATISIKNPEKDIRLGLEANVEIYTQKAENVIVVSSFAVNTDVNGTYCFVDVDGVAQRRDVTVGISSDSSVEILSGVSAGEVVILNSQNVYEGARVTNDPAFAPQTTTMFGPQ